MSQKLPSGLIYGLALLPIVAILIYILYGAENVPWRDPWDTSVTLAIKAQTDELRWQDLFVQHGEHRIVFTNLLTVILSKTTHWDIRLESYASFGLACASFWLLARLFYQDAPRAFGLGIVPFSALLFSFSQYGNWLIGFQNAWYFFVFFFTLALYILKQYAVGWRALLSAALCALCSMFSLGTGLLVWGLLIPTLWMLGYRQWRYYGVWGLISAVSYYFYFLDYHAVGNPRTANPILIAQFVALYIGNPFAPNFVPMPIKYFAPLIALVGVLLLLANTTFLLKTRRKLTELAIWLTLAEAVIGIALLTAVSRAEMSLGIALSWRYVTIAALFWLALLVLGLMSSLEIRAIPTRHRWQSALWWGNLVTFVGLTFFYVVINIIALRQPPLITENHKTCLQAYPESRDGTCLAELHPAFEPDAPPDYQASLLRSIDEIAHYRLAIFGE